MSQDSCKATNASQFLETDLKFFDWDSGDTSSASDFALGGALPSEPWPSEIMRMQTKPLPPIPQHNKKPNQSLLTTAIPSKPRYNSLQQRVLRDSCRQNSFSLALKSYFPHVSPCTIIRQYEKEKHFEKAVCNSPSKGQANDLFCHISATADSRTNLSETMSAHQDEDDIDVDSLANDFQYCFSFAQSHCPYTKENVVHQKGRIRETPEDMTKCFSDEDIIDPCLLVRHC